VRGYVDGDGSLFINSANFPGFNITSNPKFLVDICDYIEPLLNVSFSMVRKTEHTSYIYIQQIEEIMLVLDWMYKDTSIFLDRKYQKYLEIQSYYKAYLERRFTQSAYSYSCEYMDSLFEQYGNWKKVGEHLGLSSSSVLNRRKKMGCKLRKDCRRKNEYNTDKCKNTS